jgi:hypothetical protein
MSAQTGGRVDQSPRYPIPTQETSMINLPPDPVEILADVLLNATKSYDSLHADLTPHVHEIADHIMTAIRARSDEGTKLRSALGLELTRTTRTGKNINAAMSAYTDS